MRQHSRGQWAKGILRLRSRVKKLYQQGPATLHPPHRQVDAPALAQGNTAPSPLTRQASTLRVRSCRFMMG